jgi:hypothetical protein
VKKGREMNTSFFLFSSLYYRWVPDGIDWVWIEKQID